MQRCASLSPAILYIYIASPSKIPKHYTAPVKLSSVCVCQGPRLCAKREANSEPEMLKFRFRGLVTFNCRVRWGFIQEFEIGEAPNRCLLIVIVCCRSLRPTLLTLTCGECCSFTKRCALARVQITWFKQVLQEADTIQVLHHVRSDSHCDDKYNKGSHFPWNTNTNQHRY